MRTPYADNDLDDMPVEEVFIEIRYLRNLIRQIRDEKGNARCHLSLHELFQKALPEGDTSFCALADKKAFLRQCEAFWDTGQCPSVRGQHTCPMCSGSGVVPPASSNPD